MRKMICSFVGAVMVACALFPVSVRAQAFGDLGIDYVRFESGQGPITGGLGLTFRMTSKEGLINWVDLSAQSKAAWGTGAHAFDAGKFSFVLGGSIGHQLDALWAGPYVDIYFRANQYVGLGFLYWTGFFEERPTGYESNTESILQGQFGGVYLELGPVTASYYLLNFQNDPLNRLPGASIKVPASSTVNLFFSGTRNDNAKTWMWLIGGEYHPGG